MQEMSSGQLTHANSVGMPTRTLVAECSRVRDFAGETGMDAGPSTPAATRPAAADPHSQPSTPRRPGPTPPQTWRQRTSPPRAGSAAGQPPVTCSAGPPPASGSFASFTGGSLQRSQAWLRRPGPRASAPDTASRTGGRTTSGTQMCHRSRRGAGSAGTSRRNSADSVARWACQGPLAPAGAEFRGTGHGRCCHHTTSQPPEGRRRRR